MIDPSDGKPVFIYCLWCPLERRIRYIGKSVHPDVRVKKHIDAAQRRELSHNTARWIRKIRRLGFTPRLRVLFEVPSGVKWQDAEAEIIARAKSKGWRLTNQSAGGEGVTFLSIEDLDRAKQARRAGFNESVRQRMSEGVRAAWADPEKRERIRAAQIEAAKRPEKLQHLTSISRKGRTPEGEARRIAALKSYYANPENRRIASDRVRNAPKDAKGRLTRQST